MVRCAYCKLLKINTFQIGTFGTKVTTRPSSSSTDVNTMRMDAAAAASPGAVPSSHWYIGYVRDRANAPGQGELAWV